MSLSKESSLLPRAFRAVNGKENSFLPRTFRAVNGRFAATLARLVLSTTSHYRSNCCTQLLGHSYIVTTVST